MKTVSVIVPSRNRLGQLRMCLQALSRQTYPRHKTTLIVVDNDSDESLDELKGEYPDVVWLFEKAPGSYAARTRGVRAATTEIVAFTDSDCIPDAEWLENGVAELEGSGAAIVGGCIKFIDPPHRPLNCYELFEERMFYMTRHRHTIEVCRFAVTANLITHRALFDRAGMFDVELRSSGDREWSRRALACGGSLRYCDAAVVRHPRRSSFRSLYSKVIRLKGGFVEVAKKHGLDGEWPYVVRYTVFDPTIYRLAFGPGGGAAPLARAKLMAVAVAVACGATAETIRCLLGFKGARE